MKAAFPCTPTAPHKRRGHARRVAGVERPRLSHTITCSAQCLPISCTARLSHPLRFPSSQNNCPNAPRPLRLRPASARRPRHAACGRLRPATRRAGFVARARRCAPLALIPNKARRLQAPGRQGRHSGSARRRLPRTTRRIRREARPRSAQPGRSLRGGSSITTARPAVR